jgi:hypothetical protein
MECRDAQFYLRLRRHTGDELGSDVTGALDGHLAGCPACAGDARGAASFDRAITSAMRAVPMPAGLRERLITHTATKQGAILRGRLYRTGALAAAVLVFIAFGLGLISTTRPKIEPYDLAQQADEQVSNPEESTRQWLAEQKLPDRLPENFDYDLLLFRGFGPVNGKKVPVVVFRSPEGGGFAQVYIFRHNGEFDRKDIRDAQASFTHAKVVIRDPESPRGATYVIVYTGGPNGLRQFLRTNKGGQQDA